MQLAYTYGFIILNLLYNLQTLFSADCWTSAPVTLIIANHVTDLLPGIYIISLQSIYFSRPLLPLLVVEMINY